MANLCRVFFVFDAGNSGEGIPHDGVVVSGQKIFFNDVHKIVKDVAAPNFAGDEAQFFDRLVAVVTAFAQLHSERCGGLFGDVEHAGGVRSVTQEWFLQSGGEDSTKKQNGFAILWQCIDHHRESSGEQRPDKKVYGLLACGKQVTHGITVHALFCFRLPCRRLFDEINECFFRIRPIAQVLDFFGKVADGNGRGFVNQ